MNVGRRLATLAAVCFGTLAGCAIQADSGPRDIAADDPARGAIESAASGEATGEGRIYLLAPEGGEQVLRTVLRDSKDLLQRLIEGPLQGELTDGIATAVPNTLAINEPLRYDGDVLVIDVSDDLNELTGANLRLAVAQIVFTASEIPGTQAVAIRVDGEPQAWPNGEGVELSRPLTVYDFIGFAESSQPAYPVTPRNPTGAAAETTTTAVAATTSVPPVTAPGETTTIAPPGETTTIAPTTG